MKTNKAGLDLIKKFEGYYNKAYKCPAGVWTIGYGTTRINGKPVKEGMTCTKTDAEKWLASDLASAEKAVSSYKLSWMNENRFSALVSFTYNCGTGNLAKLLDDGKRTADVVSEKLLAYNKANGKVLKGLQNRREAEKALFDKRVSNYYPKYKGTSIKIDVVLESIGVPEQLRGNVTRRKPLAFKNGINPYSGTALQNLTLVNLARDGKLKRC